MSEQTWQLVQEKQALRKRIFGHNRELAKRLLNGYFRAWAGLTAHDPGETSEEAKDFAQTLWKFKSLGKMVTYALREDDRIFFEKLSQEAGEMDTPGKSKKLWQAIRWAFPRTRSKSRHQPLLMESLDAQWTPHFGRLEAGHSCTEVELFSKCVQRHETKESLGVLTLRDLPSRLEIERALHTLKNNKAAGPDGLPCELFKGAASVLSAPLMDLYAKIAAWQCEPIQCKGGLMMPVYKRGDPGVASSYRGIMLINVISKIFHRWLRQQLMSRIEDIRMDTHLHCLQTFARIARQQQLPAAALFVDIQGAYHFLIRELVMGTINSDDETLILNNLKDWQADTRGVAFCGYAPPRYCSVFASHNVLSHCYVRSTSTPGRAFHIYGNY